MPVLTLPILSPRKQIGELLRFPSSKSGDDLISLSQYTERAKEGQKSIFYIAADSLAAAASAPFVEQLIKKDLEVSRCLYNPIMLATIPVNPENWAARGTLHLQIAAGRLQTRSPRKTECRLGFSRC